MRASSLPNHMTLVHCTVPTHAPSGSSPMTSNGRHKPRPCQLQRSGKWKERGCCQFGAKARGIQHPRTLTTPPLVSPFAGVAVPPFRQESHQLHVRSVAIHTIWHHTPTPLRFAPATHSAIQSLLHNVNKEKNFPHHTLPSNPD